MSLVMVVEGVNERLVMLLAPRDAPRGRGDAATTNTSTPRRFLVWALGIGV